MSWLLVRISTVLNNNLELVNTVNQLLMQNFEKGHKKNISLRLFTKKKNLFGKTFVKGNLVVFATIFFKLFPHAEGIRIDCKGIKSHPLKKSFNFFLITTGHLVIIYMQNSLHLFTDTAKTQQGGQQELKAIVQHFLTRKFKSYRSLRNEGDICFS